MIQHLPHSGIRYQASSSTPPCSMCSSSAFCTASRSTPSPSTQFSKRNRIFRIPSSYSSFASFIIETSCSIPGRRFAIHSKPSPLRSTRAAHLRTGAIFIPVPREYSFSLCIRIDPTEWLSEEDLQNAISLHLPSGNGRDFAAR